MGSNFKPLHYLGISLLGLSPAICLAQSTTEEIIVIGTTPTDGLGQALKNIPFGVQSASADDLQDAVSLDLSDFLNSSLASVSLNAAQNNPLQSDLQYRGFTASPLLGLPQGVAVYQDGVRLNEPLGDAVNWDLVPESAVSSMQLLSGANPVFGLNALGGAINIQMKNGFSYHGTGLEVFTGNWGRTVATVESGNDNGRWGYYVNASYFEEDGWRALSPSDALNLYASLGWRNGDVSSLDLVLQQGDTDLIGNGSLPLGLIAQDRTSVFTAPDFTRNELTMISGSGSHFLTDELVISGTVYRRENDTDSFNGDASEFELCQFSMDSPALLDEPDEDALEDDLALDLDQLCQAEDPTVASFSELESLIASTATMNNFDPEEYELDNVVDDLSGTGILSDEGINNISQRYQVSEGLEGQMTLLADLFSRPNRFVAGYSYLYGKSGFQSVTELAQMDPVTRSTEGLGVGTYFDDAATDIAVSSKTWSLYFSETLEFSDRLTLVLAGRFNESDVTLRDRSGVRPELNGDHRFSRFNPALGFTYQTGESASVFASYNESNRIPTPIELSCNDSIFELARQRAIQEGEDPDDIEFECRLPNAFLADPPLDDVVTRNIELGIRGTTMAIDYSVAVFNAVNEDDIIFQTTGRASGLFANVDSTRRRGFESSLSGVLASVDWFAAYSYVDATFGDDFLALSPNHPDADADGNIAVTEGDRIPGIPAHQFKLGASFTFNDRLTLAVDGYYNSSQVLRGDESNQMQRVNGFSVFNLRGNYRINDNISLFAKVTNLFDREFESFGLLGENPDELIDDLEDNRPVFLGIGAPRGAWVGARIRF